MKRISIFGTSERIKELGGDKINRLLSLKSDSLGINSFPLYYSNVDFWLFSDQSMFEKIDEQDAYKGQKLIMSRWAHLIFNNRPWHVHELFERNEIPNDVNNSGWLALWWAVKEGYKNINLYGVMDGEYALQADGNVKYYNAFEGEHVLHKNIYNRLIRDIESGFDGKVKICRPLLKFSDAAIK